MGSVAATAPAIDLGSAGGVSYRLAERELDPPGTPKATAKCPAGKHVSGGAFVVYEPENTGTFDYSASMPVDRGDADSAPDDGWRVRATPIDEPTGVASTAMCADGHSRYRDKQEPVDPGFPVLRVSCGQGWHVTGGGASVSPDVNHVVWSHPYDSGDPGGLPDDGWRAMLYVDELNQEPTVYAVCSREQPAYRREKETLQPGNGELNEAQCSSSSHLIGAGASFTGPSSPSGIQRVAADDDPGDPGEAPDDAAEAFGLVGNSSPADELTVFAICAK